MLEVKAILLTILLVPISGCLSANDEDEDPCWYSLDQPGSPGHGIEAGYCFSLPSYEISTINGTVSSENSNTSHLIFSTSINTTSQERVVPYIYGGIHDSSQLAEELGSFDLDRDLPFYLKYNCIIKKNHPVGWSNTSGEREIVWGQEPRISNSGKPSVILPIVYNSFWSLTVREPGGTYTTGDCDFDVYLYKRDIITYLDINQNDTYSINWAIKIKFYGDPKSAYCPDSWPYMTNDFQSEDSYFITGDITITDNKICNSNDQPRSEYGKSWHNYWN
jgi:hypothetical protein